MNLDQAIKKAMRGKPQLQVKYDDFCNWYFDDMTIESTVIDLINEGTLSIKCIADKVCYLPLNLVLNKKAVNEEHIEDDEIMGVNENYTIKLLRK